MGMQGGSIEKLRRTFDHFLKELLEMTRRKRGGTIVFNVECPPSEDLVPSFISRGSCHLEVNYRGGILLRLFDTSRPGHDGAVFVHLFDEHTMKCAMRVHSSQNSLPTFPLSSSEAQLLRGCGLRHRSALCLSMLAGALIFVVSEERGTVSICRNGRFYKDVNHEQLRSALKTVLSQPQFFEFFGADTREQMFSSSVKFVTLVGSAIANKLLGPSADRSLETTSSLRGLVPDSPLHSEFVIPELLDRNSGTFTSLIRSAKNILLQLQAATDQYAGTRRHYASNSTSKDTHALALASQKKMEKLASIMERAKFEVSIKLDAIEDGLRKTLKDAFDEACGEDLRCGDTFLILENCVQSVFESALWHRYREVNLPPSLFAESKVDSLRRMARFALVRHYSQRLNRVQCVMTFAGDRLAVDVYRFTDDTTVVDASVFCSDALHNALASATSCVKAQLVDFFLAQNWTSGQCIFYVPLHAFASFRPLAAALSAECLDSMFRKPFGEPLSAYAFSIECLLKDVLSAVSSESGTKTAKESVSAEGNCLGK